MTTSSTAGAPMVRFPRFRIRTRAELPETERSELQRVADAQLEMCAALMHGLERKNSSLRFVEHCARVTALVDEMAGVLQLGEEERLDLCAAAQLHELGMIAVPLELVETASKLDPLAISRIRQQAFIGAEITRMTRGRRTALLVETQYDDFATLRRRLAPDSLDALLAGLLRVADVHDTMLHPRPYQAGLDPSLAPTTLAEGEGTRFHPLAVQSLRQLRRLEH